MKRQFKNPKQLERYLETVVHDVIMTEVLDAMIDIWLQKLEENVYDDYEPRRYKRRATEGGLLDRRNIEITAEKGRSAFKYTLENMTQGAVDTDVLINQLIESEAGFAGDPDRGMPPRPYTDEAIEIINSNPESIRMAFRRGFARHGVSIRM